MKSRSIQPKFNVHWAKIVTLPTDLKSLEAALRNLSHDDSAVRLVRDFASQLGKTKQRQQTFNAPGTSYPVGGASPLRLTPLITNPHGGRNRC